jgi:ankyrin repeat protein
MAESKQASRGLALLAAGIGVALTLACGFGGMVAALAGVFAQPAFALAVRRRSAIHHWMRDGVALALLWGIALLLAWVLIAWPLTALQQSSTLGHVVLMSVAIGIALVGLWRLWPLWHSAERDGGSPGELWSRASAHEASAWRGLGVAVSVAALLATILLMAWLGNLSSLVRWWLAVGMTVLWPALHWGLQRIAAADLRPVTPSFLHALDAHALAEDVPFDDGPPALDGDLIAPLYDAARSGRVDRALTLLEAGADAHALPPSADRDQRSLPVLAAVLPDLRLLRALIGRGTDVNASHAGMTPLLAATRDSWHGRPEAVMTLLANGADARVSDADGNTPLHHAARSSDAGVAALLRDAAADVDVVNAEGVTPLGMACAAGNWRLARFLLEHGAKAERDGAVPALLAAAGSEEDDEAGVLLLLKHKAKVDARDAHGRTALHEAALAGNEETLAALLTAGADVHAHDADGRTALLDAASASQLSVIDALIAAGATVTVIDSDCRGALALACMAETASAKVVTRLIELGADPEVSDRNGKRAIDLSAEAGRWALVAALDPGYALPARVVDDVHTDTPTDRTPLSLLRDGLQATPPYDQLESLLSLLSPRELGSVLIDPEAPQSIARMQWLLAHGADVETRDGRADTAMFALLSRGAAALTALQVLLRHGVSPAGAGGLARFIGACSADAGPSISSRDAERVALDLLERGADPFGSSSAGDPPLTLAVRMDWMHVVERLVAGGVDLEARDSHGMSALHLAAALGREAVLKMLIAHGASPQTHAADGQTPLGVALSAGRRDLADWLDWRGWPLPRRPLQASDVPAAAIVGDADAVRRLLDLGLPVDTVDAQGCTALLRAAGGGHRATVDLLLARGADPHCAANTGATALSAAVSMRHGEIVDRLLVAGADLEQRLPGDVTVLMLAAALGLPDLCARLLSAGAEVHAKDAQGLTPLHCAALFAFTARDRPRLMALLDTLLLAGADADMPAGGNVTPLLLLLGARVEPGTACDEDVVLTGLERLLDEDVSLDVQDPRGFGPLHLAALHGLLHITQRLLRAGCDPDLRDTLNRPAREIAIMRGFVDVASEFAPLVSGVSMARFLREPR